MKYDAMKCTSETGQRRVLINPTLVYIWHNQIYASKPRDAANGHRPADASGSRRETRKTSRVEIVRTSRRFATIKYTPPRASTAPPLRARYVCSKNLALSQLK